MSAPMRSLAKDQRGATLIEFAVVLAPLLFGIMGLLELGYAAYVQALLQGALQTAARDSTIAAKSASDIQEDVFRTLKPVVSRTYVTTKVQSYYNYSRIAKPEKVTTDRNGNGKFDAGVKPDAECFEDANDNGKYDDGTQSGRANTGGPDDIVAYTVSVNYPRLLPTAQLLGFSATGSLSGTTMMRNQPFAKNVEVRRLCF